MALAFVRVSQAQSQYTLTNAHKRFMPAHTCVYKHDRAPPHTRSQWKRLVAMRHTASCWVHSLC